MFRFVLQALMDQPVSACVFPEKLHSLVTRDMSMCWFVTIETASGILCGTHTTFGNAEMYEVSFLHQSAMAKVSANCALALLDIVNVSLFHGYLSVVA